MADGLRYSVHDYEGIKVLDVIGSVNAVTAHQIVSVIDRITEKESMILNMQNVHLVTSAGIDAVVDVSVRAKAKEKRVVLLWADSAVKKMAETFDYYSLLVFAESLEEGAMKIEYYT